MKRKILAAGSLGCLLLVFGIGVTIFWFVRQDASLCMVSSIEEEEPIRLEICFLSSKEAYTKEELTGLLPGETVEREPAVILDGTSPEAYIRVHLTFGGILGESASESEEARAERLKRIEELRTGIHFCEGWIEGEDGYIYYQEKVAAGSILPIYDQVRIPIEWDNEIAKKSFTIELSAEAVLSDHLEPWLQDGQAIQSWE